MNPMEARRNGVDPKENRREASASALLPRCCLGCLLPLQDLSVDGTRLFLLLIRHSRHRKRAHPTRGARVKVQ